MNTQITLEKPTLLNVIAWSTLASGIINLVWGVVAVSSIWWTIVCIPFAFLPTVLGIFEVIYAARLLSSQPQPTQPSTTIAVLEIICIVVGNIFAVIVGILALVFYNDVTVRDYFARLNESVVPASSTVVVVPPAAPVPTVIEPVSPEPETPAQAAPHVEPARPDEPDTPQG